jgi:hypothetical protein
MIGHEVEEWIDTWNQKYENLEEMYDFDFAWDLYEHTKIARVMLDELDHNLEIYTHMTFAMLEDMHPTLTPEQKADIHKMYFRNAVNIIKESRNGTKTKS